MQKLLNFVAVLTLSSSLLHAQIRAPGYIDADFVATCFNNPAEDTLALALAVQPDGRILAGGNFITGGRNCVNAIGRLRTNGVLDGTFAAPFIQGSLVNAIALQSDGKIVVGGRMGTLDLPFFPVARLRAGGGIDESFERVINDASVSINALALLPDGKTIAVGKRQPGVTLPTLAYIVKLNLNGGIDGNFVRPTDTVSVLGIGLAAVAVNPISSRIIVGGSFSTYGNFERHAIVQLDYNGNVDATFNPLISAGQVNALLIQPDQKILVAGNFTFEGIVNRALIRLNPDGSRDQSFIPVNGAGLRGLSLALQEPEGRIILGHDAGVMRLHQNGDLDTTFGPRNASQSLGTRADLATAVAMSLDNQILVGARSVEINTTRRRGVARLWGEIPPPPVIVQQPVTQHVLAGTNVTFSLIATGQPPLFFQWRKDGSVLKGATNASLFLTNVHSPDIGNYTAVVTNFGGAITSSVARLMVDFTTSPLSLVVSGTGTVSPNLNGRELEVGLSYTFTARPGKGNVFSNWTGSITSTAPVLEFVMTTNALLRATFVPSPFFQSRGAYNGVFFDPNNPAHENAGAFSLTLDERGGFRGTTRTGKTVRKFTGTFDLDFKAEAAAVAGTLPPFQLSLSFDPGAGAVTGIVSNHGAAATLTAFRNPFSSSSPTTDAGNYTVSLPGSSDPAVAPHGDGFATLAVNTAGRASAKGFLADGAALKFVSAVNVDGLVPVYVPLYGGRGSIFGWLNITHGESSDIVGTLFWDKPASVGGNFYSAGFTNHIALAGSVFPRTPGTPVLTLTDGVLTLTGGNLLETLSNDVTLGGDNKITGDNRLAVTISPTKGTLTGSFFDPATNRKRTVKGVALPKQNVASGYFLGSDESGRIVIGERP